MIGPTRLSRLQQITPDILVWDRQSRPDLANKYGINPRNNDGTFVIQVGLKDVFGLAWFLNNSFLNDTTFLAAGLIDISFSLTAPDPRLAALVNFVKAGGSKPLYAVYQEVASVSNPVRTRPSIAFLLARSNCCSADALSLHRCSPPNRERLAFLYRRGADLLGPYPESFRNCT